MKYSKRELRMLNFFALFLFGFGGFCFVFGAIEFVVQPTMSYTVALSHNAATASVQPATGGVSLPAEVKPSLFTQETQEKEGLNLNAVSKALFGLVLVVLSFALNLMLLRVMRRDGGDRLRGIHNS